MTIIKRADLGRPLTWDELDDNFQQVDDLTAAASAAVSSASASATAAAGSATNSLNSANSAAISALDASNSSEVAINALMNSTFEPSDFDFTSGGTLASTDRNKAVFNSADNNWYSWSGSLPHVVAAGTDPLLDPNWKPRTDQLLRQQLAARDGLKLIGECSDISELKNTEPDFDQQKILVKNHTVKDSRYPYKIDTGGLFAFDETDTTTLNDDWLCIVTGGGARWKRVIKDSLLNLAWYGVKPGDDITPALNAAIAYLKTAFIADAAPAYAPTIAINAGKYTISSTINKPPFIKIVCMGSVEFDAPSLTTGAVIDVFNDSTIPKPSFSGPGMNCEDISCIGGTLTITGPGKVENGVTGIVYGNKAANNAPCRGVGFRNVIIKNCSIGLSLRTYDTYLLTFSDSRLEQNFNNFVIPAPASVVNSGEAIVLSNIIFGGSGGAQIYINAGSMELIFDKCKGDYSVGDLFKIGTNCSFSSMKISNFRCEEFRGFFLTGTPNALGNVNIFFDNLTILPRPNGNTSAGNSPSRPLFDHGPGANVAVRGLEIFSEMAPYTESLNISTEAGGSLRISDYLPRTYRYLTGSNYIMNRGSSFGDETVGTLISTAPTTLSRFTVDSLSNASGQVVSLDGGKAIQVTGASTSSVIRLVSEYVPVQSGNIVALSAAVQKNSATGNLNMNGLVLWYDKDLNLISSSTSSTYDFNSAYSNTSFPNYSSGNSRKLSSPAFAKTAPAGASFCRIRAEISGFVGVMNIINCVGFKSL